MPDAPLIRAACASLVIAAQPAWAERSRLGEDAEVVDTGDCELEGAVEQQRERREPRRRTRAVELNCGIGWQSEAQLSLARQRQGSERETTWGVELKTAIVPRRGTGLGWSVIASAQRERVAGRRSRWAEATLAIEAALQPTGDWRLEAQLGTTRDHVDRRDRTPWELAVDHAFAPRWELRAQLGGEDRERPQWKLALRWEVWPDQAQLTLRYGGSSGKGHPRRWGLALTWEL